MKRKKIETFAISAVRVRAGAALGCVFKMFKEMVNCSHLVFSRKFVLCLLVIMLSMITEASVGDRRGISFQHVFGYMLIGGLLSAFRTWLSNRRAAACKKTSKSEQNSESVECNEAADDVEMIPVDEEECAAADDFRNCACTTRTAPVDAGEIESFAKAADKNARIVTLSQLHKQRLKSLLEDDEQAKNQRQGSSFFEMYCRAWAYMTRYQGRSSREEYWKFTAVDTVISFALGFIGVKLLPMLYVCFSLLPRIPLSIRRFLDAGSSVGIWIFLHLIILLSGMAAVKIGNMHTHECPVSMFYLASTCFVVAIIFVLWVLCSRSFGLGNHDSEEGRVCRTRTEAGEENSRLQEAAKDTTSRHQSWSRIRIKWLWCFLAFVVILVLVRNIRLYLRDAGAEKDRLPEIHERVTVNPQMNGDRTFRTKEHDKCERYSSRNDSQKSELKADRPYATILSDIQIPIPEGYKVVAPGSPEDIALSELDADPTPDADTKLRLLRIDASENREIDEILKVSVNKRLSEIWVSLEMFLDFTKKMAFEFETLKKKQVNGESFEILSVQNRNFFLEGLFITAIRCETSYDEGRKKDCWILVSQGVVLARGNVLFLIRYKKYEDYKAARKNASQSEAVVREWCRGIR